MARGTRGHRAYTPAQVADALRKTKGLVTVAAQQIGTDYRTIKRYIAEYAMCRQALEESRQQMGDLAEGRLFQAIDRSEMPSVHWYLKTQHRDRGYGERIDLTIYLRQEAERLADELNMDRAEAVRMAEAILAGRR